MSHDNETDKEEYIIERILKHIREGDTLRFLVRLSTKEDTVEPAHHLPQRTITRYWRYINKKVLILLHYTTIKDLLYYTVHRKENEHKNNNFHLKTHTCSTSV